MTRHIERFIFVIFLSVMLTGFSPCLADTGVVTITLPENVLRQSIESVLPLPLKPDNLEGSLVLDTIDRFELGENSARVHGVLVGKNLIVTTRIGNQDLKLKLGEMHLPLTCDFTFRFDRQQKNLFIKPNLEESYKNPPPGEAGSVLSLLALLDKREYLVSFDSMKNFQTRVGQRNLSVELEPVDVRISQKELVVKMAPKISKTN